MARRLEAARREISSASRAVPEVPDPKGVMAAAMLTTVSKLLTGTVSFSRRNQQKGQR